MDKIGFKQRLLFPKHVNTEIVHNLEVFTAKVFSKTTLNGNNLAELCRNIYMKDLKKKDIKNDSANVKNR